MNHTAPSLQIQLLHRPLYLCLRVRIPPFPLQKFPAHRRHSTTPRQPPTRPTRVRPQGISSTRETVLLLPVVLSASLASCLEFTSGRSDEIIDVCSPGSYGYISTQGHLDGRGGARRSFILSARIVIFIILSCGYFTMCLLTLCPFLRPNSVSNPLFHMTTYIVYRSDV